MKNALLPCAIIALLLSLTLLLACGSAQEAPERDREDRPARESREDREGQPIEDEGADREGSDLLIPEDTSPETDRAALEALYHAAGGPNWEASDNWLTNAPLSEWHEVSADATGRVTRLALNHNRLTGEILRELGNLSNLEELYLDGNRLSGELPPELGNLSNLKWLGLESNDLGGELPPELGNLTNLNQLLLARNQLTGEIPPELGNLANLRKLLLGEQPAERENTAGVRQPD